MKIEILCTGCTKCIQLVTLSHDVLNEAGKSDVEIRRVDNERAIRRFMPLDRIPGLVIDGHLVSSGQVPDRGMLRGWLHAGETVE